MSFEPVVAEIMTSDPTVLAPEDRVRTAIEEMELAGIRHLPVVDAGVLVGLVSQRDLAEAGDEQTVGKIMATDLKTVAPETPAHEAAYLLLRHRIGCVPVVSDEGRLVGIVTESDFVRVAHALLGGHVSVDELEHEEEESERV